MTAHMALHVLLMSIVAPAVAYHARSRVPKPFVAALWLATATQVFLLWLWHTPLAMAMVHSSPAIAGISHALLFAAAIWFWSCIIGSDSTCRWQSLIALLVTGKLVCLLAILLLFAPRAIYAASHFHGESADLLSDQQNAGLVMLVACPLTYIATAVFIASRWLKEVALYSWTPSEESGAP